MDLDPEQPFCPNLDCAASGQRGQGTRTSHGRKRPRYACSVCRTPFSARPGTPFYRRRTAAAVLTQVLTLVAHGGPIPAIEAAFGLQTRPVQAGVTAAGQPAQQRQPALVEQPRDLQQVQADEIRVKPQPGVVWLALALMVSPRLWLGGTVSRPRDLPLILRLAQIVWRCASGAPLRLISAGFAGDPTAWRRVFRTPERTGQRGAPRQIPWPQLHVGQGIKDRRGAIGMGRRLVPGTGAGIMAFRRTTPGCRVANTADLDRRNGPFRARVACLARRTRGLVRQVQPLAHGR